MPIKIIKGDITEIPTDAIVNAANPGLKGGGGVDGAIHAAGGPEILKECMEIVQEKGNCLPGEAVVTTAGQLPAKIVIHTVGPVWRGGQHGEPEHLASCYRKSIELANENECTRISFPNISTGVYGYPKDLAAKVAISTTLKELDRFPEMEVYLVCFDPENEQVTTRTLEEMTSKGR